MIDLSHTISTIEQHLADGSTRSLTYAALECRLGIERVCYDRLRNMHDYISHEEIYRWQPAHVIRILAEEVDPDVAETYTLSISRGPSSPENPPISAEDYAALDYVEVGTQIGFRASYLQKLWNAVSNVALHVSLPKSRSDAVPAFGDPHAIRKQVEAALAELKRIAVGNMIATGVGREVSFDCACGASNKRRIKALSAGKVVRCVNPDCPETWEVEITDGEYLFGRRGETITCKCDHEHWVALTQLEKIPKGGHGSLRCGCGIRILVRWQLAFALQPPNEDAAPNDLKSAV